MKIFGNIQGGSRKFLGHLKCHFESHIIQIKQTASHLMNESKICKVSFIAVCKTFGQYTINCFANISTEEACTMLLGN